MLYLIDISINYTNLKVFGGALGNYCKFSTVRNTKTHGPIINYDIILISIPM
jgi:hypothetical protein